MPLTNSQYDSLMRSYARRQAESRQELSERLEKIESEIPELSGLNASITSLQAKRVRLAVEGDQEGKKAAGRELASLQEQRLSLLADHGLRPSDLEPRYVCASCKDTGYVEGKKCRCFYQAEIDLLYHQSRLQGILEQENFDTFSYSWYEGEDLDLMKRNVRDAHLFIDSFDTSFQNLLLLGPVGTGKTFLSHCIAKELLDSCHSVVYLTAFELFDLLSKAVFGHDRDAAAYRQSYPYIFDCDLLIIDDLGTELSNSFTVSQFFLCVNERILRKKSTLISSNLDIKGLQAAYSERTLSRIISSYTIRQLSGKDIRIKKKLS